MGPRCGKREISTVDWQGHVSMEFGMKPYEQMQGWVGPAASWISVLYPRGLNDGGAEI